MTKTLRKRHLQIWTILALLLPVGIISGWLVIPREQNIKLLQPAPVKALPVVFKSIERASYAIKIRTDEAKQQWQMEWKSKCILTIPSAVIYKLNEPAIDSAKRELIGRIESTGDYIFPLKNDSTTAASLHFILYDFIHEQTMDTINF